MGKAVQNSDNELAPLAGEEESIAGVLGTQQDPSQQRASTRFTLLIRAAKIVSSQGEFVGVVRDVSETGVCVRFFHNPPFGEPLELHMPHGEMFPIEQAWSRGSEAGYRFAKPTTVSQLVSGPNTYPQRPLRLGLVFPIQIRTLTQKSTGLIENVSQQGARFETSDRFAIDQSVTLDCLEEGVRLKDVRAKIRWRRGDQYGAVFDDTFSLKDFARFAAHMQCPQLVN